MKSLNENFLEDNTKDRTEVIDDGKDYNGYILSLHGDKNKQFKKKHKSSKSIKRKINRFIDNTMINIFGKTFTKKSYKQKKKSKKILRRITLVLISIILLIGLSVVAMFGIGNSRFKNNSGPMTSQQIEIGSEIIENKGDVIKYNGHTYKYNHNMVSLLVAGIDKEKLEEVDIPGTAGQSDLILVIALDTNNGQITTFSVSRETMADVNIYNSDGKFIEQKDLQICLSYAYGDGREKSYENLKYSVSRLFYGIKMDSYFIFDLSSIELLNDSIGGVTITMPCDMTLYGINYNKGDIVTLRGEAATYFVRARDINALDSNNYRMQRQKIYLEAFTKTFINVSKEYYQTPSIVYDIVSNNMLTNLDFSQVSYLGLKMFQKGSTNLNIVSLPGDVVEGKEFAEFHVREKDFFEMLLNVYYKKVD